MTETTAPAPNGTKGVSGLQRAVLIVLGGFCFAVLGWLGRQAWLLYDAPFEIPLSDTRTDFDDLLPKEFDYSNLTIPYNELQIGGPPIDGIPSLTEPEFVSAAQADYLQDSHRVIGVSIGGESKAYPLMILEHHEAVNDRIGETALLITYCPLSDSSAVFDRRIDERELTFGLSGLLFNSNMLLYDRDHADGPSLWSQIKASAVSGPLRKTPLKALPMELTTWADWRSRHPGTLVLSDRTGHDRDYASRPFETYFALPQLMSSVKPPDARMAPKTPVLAVWSGEASRVYPLDRFSHLNSPAEFPETLGGHSFRVRYSPAGKALSVLGADENLKWMFSYWFAWAAIQPSVEISNRPAIP